MGFGGGGGYGQGYGQEVYVDWQGYGRQQQQGYVGQQSYSAQQVVWTLAGLRGVRYIYRAKSKAASRPAGWSAAHRC